MTCSWSVLHSLQICCTPLLDALRYWTSYAYPMWPWAVTFRSCMASSKLVHFTQIDLSCQGYKANRKARDLVKKANDQAKCSDYNAARSSYERACKIALPSDHVPLKVQSHFKCISHYITLHSNHQFWAQDFSAQSSLGSSTFFPVSTYPLLEILLFQRGTACRSRMWNSYFPEVSFPDLDSENPRESFPMQLATLHVHKLESIISLPNYF